MRWTACGTGILLGVLGCSSTRRSVAATAFTTPTLVRVVASDYAFDSSRTVPAGLLAIRLVNRGHAIHMLNLARLESGKTAHDLFAALVKNPDTAGVETDLGGPNAVSPGDSATAFAVLQPGQYVMICWVPDSAGKYHAVRGMMSGITVTGTTAGAPQEPVPDVNVRESDYHIEMSPVPGAGPHVIRVDNDGPQEHDLEVLRILPGKTVAEVLDWFEAPAKGVPAAEALGGLAGMTRWGHGEFSVDLTPGRYVFLCWVPDAKDGKPHFRHGMVRPFTVN